MKQIDPKLPLTLVPTLAAILAAAPAGCGDRSGGSEPATPTAKSHDHDHDHDHHHDHDHGHAAMGHGHHGSMIELGEMQAGPFRFRATRDEGEIVAGGEAPIDVWIDPAGDAAPRVVAVRFWIGDEEGLDSVKARASIEDMEEPTRWHTHAEIPDPLPAGSRLWVEVEDAAGARTRASFDLKG